MKKTFIFIMVMLSLSMFQSKVFASEKNIAFDTINKNEISKQVQIKFNRLEEIKSMDKSAISRIEKKTLRKEAREIRSHLKSTDKNIPLAIVGSVIVIAVMVLALL